MNVGEMDLAIEQWRAWLSGAPFDQVDVEIAGQIFGGRPGEAPQRPRSHEWEGDTLRMAFNTTESLVVRGPSGIELGSIGGVADGGVLIIPEAREVRWGWHYYGRPETPENWCVLTYRFADGQVTKEVTGPTRSAIEAAQVLPRAGAAAVRLVPLSLRFALL